jgi:OmpA-OmpF porin, OOP family
MNKLNTGTDSEYLVCSNCSYDANSQESTNCEICGNPLALASNSIGNRQQEPEQKLKLKSSSFKLLKFFLPLILVLIAGRFVWSKNQFFATNIDNRVETNTTNNYHQKLEKITLLGDTFSGYSTFRDRQFQEKLKQVGLQLNYQDEFDQTNRANLLDRDRADLVVTTLDRFVQHQPQGKIVGMLDRTVGADAIVLNTLKYPNLKSLVNLEQLVRQSDELAEELSLTYAGDTPSEYLALVLDTKFDSFNISDFNVKKVPDASNAWQLLQNPQENIAVAVLWEPYVTEARKQGHTVILSSKDAPKSIIDVIVASDRLIESQPETISKFLTAYYRTIDANVREPSDLKQQIAEDGNLSPRQALAVLRGIDFFTAIESQDWMKNGTLVQRIQSIAATLVLTGRMERVPANPDDLFTSQFMNEAVSNTKTLIGLIRADNPDLAARFAGKEITIPVPQITANQIKLRSDIGNLQVKGEVLFGSGSATLSDRTQDTLDRLAQTISEFNERTVAVAVIGHTSKSGSPSANLKLSQQRAQVVAQALRDRGLKHQIIAEGKGFYLPLSNLPLEDSRQQRTEIRLIRFN